MLTTAEPLSSPQSDASIAIPAKENSSKNRISNGRVAVQPFWSVTISSVAPTGMLSTHTSVPEPKAPGITPVPLAVATV